MRRLLLLLMIALLPLRALVGDAMAMAMVSAPAHGMAQAEALADTAPCADHTAVEVDVHHSHSGHLPAGADTDSPQGHAHGSCDLCNGPAMGHTLPDARTSTGAHGIKPAPVERFVSFEPQRGIKPPIS